MDRAQISPGLPRWTLALCTLQLAAFAVISYFAVLTKNATIDEPAHAMSGWIALRHGDFRVETVNPPLWKCWAVIPNLLANPPLTHSSNIWGDRTWDPADEVIWASRTLYNSPGFDGDAFINRSRGMMLGLALLLGILIANWSYRLAGSRCRHHRDHPLLFRSHFHRALTTGQKRCCVCAGVLLLARAVWQLGQRATLLRLILVALLCGMAINIKFSALLSGRCLRFCCCSAWRWARGIFWFGIEAMAKPAFCRNGNRDICRYFLRFSYMGLLWISVSTSAIHDVSMDMPAIYQRAQVVEATAELMRAPTSAEIAAHAPSSVACFVRWADDRHLLPQACSRGFCISTPACNFGRRF